jgi:hypothetical protein
MTDTHEAPLPDMPELPTLWAVHVQGPDDIIATVDRVEAERHTAAINDWYKRQTKRPDFDPETFPRVRAEVIEWPHSRNGHAEDVARGDVRWAA